MVMFNTGLGNAKVNGHLPGVAAKRRAGGITLSCATPSVPAPAHSYSHSHAHANTNGPGPLKFSDRLKVLRKVGGGGGDPDPGGAGAGAGGGADADDQLTDKDDPYAFSESDSVLVQQYQNTANQGAAKVVNRIAAKALSKRSNSSSGEPTGLNMTRLYPAISSSVGHSFFNPHSPQSAALSPQSDTKTTLASLLESSMVPDGAGALPKSSCELERAFSFPPKELNCFPNLTSPQPPEQTSNVPVVNSKVSPVTHGGPVTPQRESNKLAALFSPTYPNSKGSRLSKAGRNNSRDGKHPPRIGPNDRRASLSSLEKQKDSIKSVTASVSSFVDGNLSASKKSEEDEYSKTTMNRLQAKIARNRVTGKHKKVDSIRVGAETLQRRHSLNDLSPRKERSLLEEHLVGPKPAKTIKREPISVVTAASPPPVPAATTRVPGACGSLTLINSSPNALRNVTSSRQPKAQATYCSPKSSRTQAGLSANKQNPAVPPKSHSSSASASSASSLCYLSASASASARSAQTSRHPKRSRAAASETTIKHEALQRLQPSAKSNKGDPFVSAATIVETDGEDSDLEEGLVYQKHWFSGWREAGSGLSGEERREGRLSQLRAELRRKLRQVWSSRRDPAASPLPSCVMDAAVSKPSQTAVLLSPNQKNHRTGRSKLSMLVQRKCVFINSEGEASCTATALPCARHCARHIMYNVDQLLFEHCTAKFADNTQCCVPVFDFCHELPLCLEHAQKRDNYQRMCQESKPKKPRRKAKPSAMTRSSKRSKKKKKQKQTITRSLSFPVDSVTTHDSDNFEASLGAEVSSSPSGSAEIYVTDDAFIRITEPEADVEVADIKVENLHDVATVDVVDVGVEEVLGLPLDGTDLAEQASRLLEEHDLNNVLNQIPADAFNDLFTEDKNGEPTREETEELERALAAVDKDVKSLERMSQTHMLLGDLSAKGLAKLPTVVSATELLPGASVPPLDPNSSAAQVFLDIDKLAQAPVLFDDKLSNAHGLLENLLDDQTLVQTLTAQLPDIPTGTNSCLSAGGVVPVYYHNGYSVTGNGVPANTLPLYQTLQPTSNMAASVIHTQPDLHS